MDHDFHNYTFSFLISVHRSQNYSPLVAHAISSVGLCSISERSSLYLISRGLHSEEDFGCSYTLSRYRQQDWQLQKIIPIFG